MRVTAKFSSPSVSRRANRISTSDQLSNISLMTGTLSPYCCLSWPISPSSSRVGRDESVSCLELPLTAGFRVPARPPRVAKPPPRPPRPEPLPREAAGLDCTSDIAEILGCVWRSKEICGGVACQPLMATSKQRRWKRKKTLKTREAGFRKSMGAFRARASCGAIRGMDRARWWLDGQRKESRLQASAEGKGEARWPQVLSDSVKYRIRTLIGPPKKCESGTPQQSRGHLKSQSHFNATLLKLKVTPAGISEVL